ncbi:MAG TPA: toll/interleukin-1 receptor domain-containing protein [Pyrinomonadaceae bacterium]|nr:toll/interleukin-1 receptor domain-containing protein [Pyrinomonadaceae bacterium]
MANHKHLEILDRGVKVWNEWRDKHRDVYPDLINANLIGANLVGADLIGANLSRADLSRANLMGADLSVANLSRANLSGADFTTAELYYTMFADNDLSEVKGLETVIHIAPSSIGVDTLYKSAGKIPEVFLRGCGVPDDFIAFIPSHFGIQQAIQFYSCFISYNTRDEEFARRLYSRMRDEHLRVWFAPEDVKGGEKLYEQIERAIQVHDRLLIVLSENSLRSKWVMTEIRRARKVELRENRRKLFPIRLVDYETLQAWECFDADTGEDLASEVRQYFIPDFSNWKEHDAFEKAFERLLRDLRDEEKRA